MGTEATTAGAAGVIPVTGDAWPAGTAVTVPPQAHKHDFNCKLMAATWAHLVHLTVSRTWAVAVRAKNGTVRALSTSIKKLNRMPKLEQNGHCTNVGEH